MREWKRKKWMTRECGQKRVTKKEGRRRKEVRVGEYRYSLAKMWVLESALNEGV